MPNPKPPYPPEFRAEAVRLALQPGQTIRGVSRDLGVSNETLRLWIRRGRADRGETSGLTTDERAELVGLRRRVKTLETEREILKKAAAFFARETDATR
jgi:transposase